MFMLQKCILNIHMRKNIEKKNIPKRNNTIIRTEINIRQYIIQAHKTHNKKVIDSMNTCEKLKINKWTIKLYNFHETHTIFLLHGNNTDLPTTRNFHLRTRRKHHSAKRPDRTRKRIPHMIQKKVMASILRGALGASRAHICALPQPTGGLASIKITIDPAKSLAVGMLRWIVAQH